MASQVNSTLRVTLLLCGLLVAFNLPAGAERHSTRPQTDSGISAVSCFSRSALMDLNPLQRRLAGLSDQADIKQCRYANLSKYMIV